MARSGKPAARLVALTSAIESRGSLSAATVDSELPFVPARMFVVYDVPTGEPRGGHAHRQCHQFLVVVAGSLTVDWHDGHQWYESALDSPTIGLHIPPGVWGVQRAHSAGAVLVVLASHRYDLSDYVSDFTHFCELFGSGDDR
jgi:UDP-2-acetamido-3-amino-2,3-dideoxy-glucuronate N-acetyltransferase